MAQRPNDFVKPLVAGDLQPAPSSEKAKHIVRHIQKWSFAQATAATASQLFVAEGPGRIVSVKAMSAGSTPSASESMSVDVTIDATSCLSAAITLNDTSGQDQWIEGTIDHDNAALALGDSVLIALTYTAGTPTPMTDTYVVVMYEYEQQD